MPDMTINIGNRSFEVSCQSGEEQYLLAAAAQLDVEAQNLITSTGRIPEARMLLLAGLMLGDRVITMEQRLEQMEKKIANRDAVIVDLQQAGTEAASPLLEETLSRLAEELERAADALEAQLASVAPVTG